MRKRDCRQMAYYIVEMMLRNRAGIKRAVAEMRAAQQCMRSGSTGVQVSNASDPTGKEALKAMTPIPVVKLELRKGDELIVYEPEKWLEAMDIIYDECPVVERKIMLYFYGGKSALETALSVGVDESTVYRIRNEFRHMMTELACQLGLVYVAKPSDK